MSYKHQKWQVLTKKSILVKKPWFEVFRESVRLPDGKVISEYYGIEMPHYTAVFAVTEDQKIIVLRCYRHAIGEITLTMPGGMIEEGESPLEGVKRELLEETGFVAKEWKPLGTFVGYPTRGCVGPIICFLQPEPKVCKNRIQETLKNWNYCCGLRKKLNRRLMKKRHKV